MSEKLVIQKSTLVNIADGVRLKRGHSNNILVSNLRAEIDQISVPTEQLPEPSIQCYGVDISTSISDYDNVDGIYCDIYMDGTYALQQVLGDSVDISSLIGSQGVTTGDVHTLFAVAKKEGYIPSKVGPPLHICYNGIEWEETDAPSGVSLLPQPSLSYNSDGDFEIYCEGVSAEATAEWYINNTFETEWGIMETVQLDSFGSGTANGEARLFSVVVKDGGKQSPMSNALLYYWSESDGSFVEEIPAGSTLKREGTFTTSTNVTSVTISDMTFPVKKLTVYCNGAMTASTGSTSGYALIFADFKKPGVASQVVFAQMGSTGPKGLYAKSTHTAAEYIFYLNSVTDTSFVLRCSGTGLRFFKGEYQYIAEG